MSRVRHLVDPHDTLPYVGLETTKYYEEIGYTKDHLLIIHAGEQVGKCAIDSFTSHKEGVANFDGIEIGKGWRGKGIGLATYILAIELSHSRGLVFKTQDWGQKPAAKRIWEILAERGVADVVSPFTPSHRFEGQFQGIYRVPIEQ